MAVSIARTHECDGYDRGLSTAFSTAVRTYVSEYFKENTIIITAVIVKRTIYLHERLLDQSNILFDVNILLEELKSIQTFTVPSSTKVRPSSDSDEICRRILLIQSCVTLKTDLYDLDQMGKTSRFLGNTMYDQLEDEKLLLHGRYLIFPNKRSAEAYIKGLVDINNVLYV
ncbi:unnamed protein product [Didymodactylos carnosus]|uniref:Uncharacterized protein n=1 Tax=Didymodactylos carnosus TaxID=1234261 RepID=A0A815HQP5_9BILA|nr:unnamed protein product [Didymodactylos carnosus]CAF4228917.1 unnamed protein product [Didymodactylos carnosus]